MSRVIIVGGGLAGSLAAMALARGRPDIRLLLIEHGERFGGSHTWSFFDTDVASDCRWVLESIDSIRWPAHEVRFPDRTRIIDVGYNSIRSVDLDRAVRAVLRPDQYRLGANVDALKPSCVLVDGETLSADAVIDARGPAPMPGLHLGWQKFIGRYYRFARPHGLSLPVIMDATVAQIDGYRFVYQLPISATELLIEDTYYAATASFDEPARQARLTELAAWIGAGPADVVEEESGVLPVVLGGEVESLWLDSEVPLLGLRGGFFHPTTSYSLPDAVTNAALLVRQRSFETADLYRLLRRRARQLWRDRAFFRLLNRMLFHAAEPHQAYRVLEHFYRLPQPIISRFYAGRLSGLDKARILSGKPPVPVGRALSVLRGRAA